MNHSEPEWKFSIAYEVGSPDKTKNPDAEDLCARLYPNGGRVVRSTSLDD